jgi:hypothetical protein
MSSQQDFDPASKGGVSRTSRLEVPRPLLRLVVLDGVKEDGSGFGGFDVHDFTLGWLSSVLCEI